jgi:VCBS repeat-containing protein
VAIGTRTFDVTASVQAWAGGATNYGWAFLPSGTNGWDFYSAEGTTTPKLTIDYTTGSTTPSNTAPVVTADSGVLTYTENAPATAIAPGLTIADDGTSLVGATVKIGTGYASGQDSLAFTALSGNPITGTWDATTRVLTLSGTATVAQYQAALRTVGYVNSSDNPSTATNRTIEFQVNDGAAANNLSTIVTRTVQVTPVNDAPVAANDAYSTNQGQALTILAAAGLLANDTDVDSTTRTALKVSDPAHGTLTLNPNGSFTYTPAAGYSGSDSFTYKANDGALDSATATVNLTISPLVSDRPFAESYIATTFPGGRQRVLEHDNASKSFFVDGDWYAVLPDGAKWYVERFDGPVPAADQQGGWTRASTDNFLANNRASDIAWDSATQKLYVLQYYEGSSTPSMFKLGYNPTTHSFTQEATAQMAGTGGQLSATHWGLNKELVIGMDQFGTPLVADVGTATSGSNQGIHLAWASKDLTTWAETTIDPIPTAAGGNSKVDIVTFKQGGQDFVGLAYSADNPATSGVTGDVWKFAWHVASSNPADYATGWQIQTFNSTVGIDNHLSAVWDGSNIFIAMKDDRSAVWLTKGLPGSWQTTKVANGDSGSVSGPSRPTLVVDHATDSLHVFYQEHTSDPKGDIYMKSVSLDGPLAFDPTFRGTPVMDTSDGSSLTDPQPPLHPVDASMDGGFFMVASNMDAREVWYNQIGFGSPELLV